ncbi:selenocysteine-specific translation elongation factor [Vagococcus sp. BWB3-3]|uniref:Selenocysteine-specific elongation factor n=1 Tax=Vagococcus allomyrinae TaxID=2794353 RepID=A0A940PBN9_9ENTE|nr:selenocysteine-specific translation elongation factor [Vagococcus allomyrinae]MBP1040506.1 selenocysteine-specific translation elongation factor [Vagococcus allomyrinae]
MTHLVVGTAGHIDHGKTTLIKALTGIETDTTKEERKRGLSINLGFAYLDLPNQQRVGVVDVPGHEKFVKNMIAGLPGINLVLLVIDANEGIMPQTKEHIDILTLLGITEFIIVLTKVATVEEEMKELVVADIREQLSGTPLEEAEIIETDALSGVGIEALKLAIETMAQQVNFNKQSLPARLNVDRVFSVKGFGTVVTGTLIEGSLATGDELLCLPSYQKVKIRNIQVHEQDVKSAVAGQRTALNLSNLKVTDISRGDVLTVADNLSLAWMLDGKVKCLERHEAGIGLWERVRLLIGTQEVMARIVPIGIEALQAGAEGFVQFRLEEQLAVKQGDRFIIRGYSPVVTIGGGVVLDSNPQKHRRFKDEVVESLTIKDQGSLQDLVLDFLNNKQEPLTKVSEISQYLSLEESNVTQLLEELVKGELVIQIGDFYLTTSSFTKVASLALDVLTRYHKDNRLRRWMPLEEFRSKIQLAVNHRQLDLLLGELTNRQKIILSEHGIGDPNFEIVLNSYHQKEKERILAAVLKSQFVPLKAAELLEGNQNAQEVMELLVDSEVVYLTHEYVIAKTYLDQAYQIVKEIIDDQGEMTLADFRNQTESSRKASMLILEYFDKQLLTKRVESVRVLSDR